MTTSKFYCDTDICPGDFVYMGNLDRAPSERYGRTQEIHMIDLATYSDYSGSGAVEMSNYRSMLANEDLKPHLVAIYGDYGTHGLAFLGSPEDAPEDVRDALAALSEYPLYSDDDHSVLETELEREEWANYGKRDFARALTAMFDRLWDEDKHDVDSDDVRLDELWLLGCDTLNINGGSGFIIETGGTVHFYIDEWIETAEHRLREGTAPQELATMIGDVAGDATVNDDDDVSDAVSE